jgi:hypothetical protein
MNAATQQTSTKRTASSSPPRTPLEELAIHDQLVAEAEELPSLLEQAQKSAMADLMEARGALQRMYAFTTTDERDVVEVARLTKAANAAEQAADRRWSDEVVGATEAAKRARDRRAEWIDSHIPQLAGEMIKRATAARERKIAALEALLAAQYEDAVLGENWTRILGPYERSMQTGEKKPQRLHGWGVNETQQVSAIYGRVAQKFYEVVDAARQVEVEGLKRAIPLEWDTERGGVIPGAP